MTGFCPILSEFVIVSHNILPTTSPFADLRDEIVLSVIPKPITSFLGLILLSYYNSQVFFGDTFNLAPVVDNIDM